MVELGLCYSKLRLKIIAELVQLGLFGWWRMVDGLLDYWLCTLQSGVKVDFDIKVQAAVSARQHHSINAELDEDVYNILASSLHIGLGIEFGLERGKAMLVGSDISLQGVCLIAG